MEVSADHSDYLKTEIMAFRVSHFKFQHVRGQEIPCMTLYKSQFG